MSFKDKINYILLDLQCCDNERCDHAWFRKEATQAIIEAVREIIPAVKTKADLELDEIGELAAFNRCRAEILTKLDEK